MVDLVFSKKALETLKAEPAAAKVQAAPAAAPAPQAAPAPVEQQPAETPNTGNSLNRLLDKAIDAVSKLPKGELTTCTAEQEVNGDTANCKPRGSGPTR